MEVDVNRETGVVPGGVAAETPPPVQVLTADGVDDYAVAVALALRHGRELGWLPVLRPPGSRLPEPPFAVASLHQRLALGLGLDRAEWTDFQRLWYRWHAPLDRVPPMRWHLTAAWPERRRPAELAAEVDGCLQELALTPPGQRAGFLSGVLGPGAGTGVLLGCGESTWALPAMLHAALTSRRFVWFESAQELLEAVGAGDGEPLVAVPLHQLDLDLVNALTDAGSFNIDLPRLRHVHFQSRPLSFLTARTIETLSRVVIKHELYRSRPIERAAWVFTGEGGARVDPDVTLLGRDEASAAHVELLDSPELLMLDGHSREDLFHLGRDCICGRSADAVEQPPDHPRLPACVHDGRCVKEGRVLAANELPARAAVIGGCNLMRLGGRGSFAPEYTIAFSALEGACNLVVASRRTRFGYAFEHVLMHQLLRTGRSFGEAVRLVNNTLPLSGPEAPDYMVLGDGGWRLYREPGAPAAAVELEPVDEGWWLTASQVDAPLLEVRLPSLAGEITVLPAEGDDLDDLHFSVAPEPDGTARLFLFGWRRLVASRLRLWVGTRPPAEHQVAALRRAHRNQAYARLFRGAVARFENQERELRSLSVHVARRLHDARHQVGAAADMLSKAAEAERLLERMDAGICGHLLERIGGGAFVWMEQYMEVDGSFEVAEQLPVEIRCPYCDSPVVARVYRHVYDPAVAREFDLCQTCGNVWDLPLGGIRPRFTGPDVLPREGRVPQEVVLHNELDHTVRGWLGFRVYQADRFGVRVTPAQALVSVEPGADTAVPFEIEVGSQIPAHMEFLRGFWVSAMDVAVFQKNIWAVPAGQRDREDR